MAIDGDGVEWQWQVVSRRKGGKSKQKQVAESPIESPTKSQSRKQELFDGSPSMHSIRSGVSTKDSEAGVDEPVSFPASPNMVSSWSDTSTELPPSALDEYALTEESCSLQPSSSGASLEDTAVLDACQKRSKASRNAKQRSKKASHSVPAPTEEVVEPLGSTWDHNGRRDEAAEWRLKVFQPLWMCASPDVPHVPVSVESVDGGLKLVIKQTFLNLEPTFDLASSHRRRARSLDARLPCKQKA